MNGLLLILLSYVISYIMQDLAANLLSSTSCRKQNYNSESLAKQGTSSTCSKKKSTDDTKMVFPMTIRIKLATSTEIHIIVERPETNLYNMLLPKAFVNKFPLLHSVQQLWPVKSQKQVIRVQTRALRREKTKKKKIAAMK